MVLEPISFFVYLPLYHVKIINRYNGHQFLTLPHFCSPVSSSSSQSMSFAFPTFNSSHLGPIASLTLSIPTTRGKKNTILQQSSTKRHYSSNKYKYVRILLFFAIGLKNTNILYQYFICYNNLQ